MKPISRRNILTITALSSTASIFALTGCGGLSDDGNGTPEQLDVEKHPDELIHLASHVLPLKKWEAGDLFTFCNAMKMPELESLALGLEVDAKIDDLTKPKLLSEIHTNILWQSSNVLSYPFKSAEDIDYHSIVAWCAEEVGVDRTTSSFTSTFDLEQAIVKKQFVEIWDKLDITQRQTLLEKIDPDHSIADHAAIAALSGSAALATLSTTVFFSGFAFYTTMSVVIATVAGWFGVTLPFAVYTSASSTVAVLAGPIGWAIGAVLVAAAVAWTGRASVKKTTAAVMQLHALKAGALYCDRQL